jgi:hypothetical protein
LNAHIQIGVELLILAGVFYSFGKAIGNRQRGTGNREQATGNRQQGIGNRQYEMV